MPLLMASVAVLSLAMGLATYLVTGSNFGPSDLMSRAIMHDVLIAVLKAMVVAPLAVAIHRFILLDDLTPRLSFTRAHTWLFFGWTFSLQISTTLIAYGRLTYERHLAFDTLSRAIQDLFASTSIVIWIITIYLAMIFPAVATDVPSAGPMQRIVTSLRQMRSNFWRFVGGAVLAELPLLIPILLITVLLQRMMMNDYIERGVAHAHVPLQTGGWFLAICLISGVETVAVVAVAAAVASWTYATLDLKE